MRLRCENPRAGPAAGALDGIEQRKGLGLAAAMSSAWVRSR